MLRFKAVCALLAAGAVSACGVCTPVESAQAVQTTNDDGPPAWVLDAWATGNPPVVPEDGPPAWVVEAWQNGERPVRPAGPPPWVAERHGLARELGLPGPPPEILDAWEAGAGFDLPGPPEFIWDLLGDR